MSELYDSVAKGDWVLAFGLLTSLLTRFFAIKPLQAKIPKSWLRYVAVVLGVLTQASAALASGASWGKAAAVGVEAGLIAIGMWEAGLKAAPLVKKASGTVLKGGKVIMFFPLLLLLMAPVGCATDFPGKVAQTSIGVAAARRTARQGFKVKCGLAVDECKKTKGAASQPTLDSCKVWKDCDTLRAEIFAAASAIQTGLDTALMLWDAGKPEDAKGYLDRALAAYKNLQEKITKYKLLDEVMK